MTAVYVVHCRRRSRYVLRWFDGARWRQRQAAGRTRRLAEAERCEFEQSLRQLGPTCAERWDWGDFWSAYISTALATARPATIQHAWSAKAAIGAFGRPDLADISPAWCAQAIAWLTRHHSPATAASYGRRLRAAVNWAAGLGLVARPRLKLPRAAEPRGRALTLEEFERVQMAARQLFPAQAAALCDFLAGLWSSGFRLGELADLTWDDPSRWHCYQAAGGWWLVEIPACRQKSGRAEVIPCPPGLAARLERTPPAARTGRVFAAAGLWSVDTLGRRIAACGRRAGVLVRPGRSATAHDLRRSFAMRWAEAGLSEAELAAILRHRSTATTRRYYETIDAGRLARRLFTLAERMHV